MTYEVDSLGQAEMKKFFRSTFSERKIMSTKTSFKRIAAVAALALTLGGFSAVSAHAGAGDAATNASIASLTVTNPTTPSVGVPAAFTIAVTNATTIAAGTADTYKIRAKITSAPSGGLSAFTGAFVPVTGWTDASSGANLLGATWSTGNRTAATVSIGTLTFTPAVAGTYTINFYHDANLDGIQEDNEVYQTASITVGATSSLAANQFPNSADTTASTDSTTVGIKVSSVGLVVTQPSGRVGTQVGFKPAYLLTRNAGATAANSSGTMAGKYATIAYSVTNPAGTAVTVYSAQGGTTASASQAIAGSGTGITLADTAVAVAQSVSLTTGYPQLGSTVYFPTATAGTYTITAFDDANQDGLVSVGEATTTSTVTIVADALPSILFTTYGQSTPAQAVNGGKAQLVKISLKNGTAAASLGASEVLTITGPTGTVIDNQSVLQSSGLLAMQDAGDGVSTTLTQANFDRSGNAYINVGNSTAGGGTYTLTGSIAGGTGAGASGTGSFTVVDTTTYPVAATLAKFTSSAVTNPADKLGVKGATITGSAGASSSQTWSTKRGVATTVTGKMAVGAIASTTYTATYTDTLGLVTGMAGSVYKMAVSTGATVTALTAVSFSVAVPALTSSQVNMGTLAIDVNGTSDVAYTRTITISNEAAAATFSYVDPAATAATYSIRAGVGSSNKFTATVTDQFGNAMANIAVAGTIAGRNATTVIPTLITDANGQVSYTLADVYTGTALLTDTLTFAPATGATSAVTVNYATYLPAATITMTTPDSANATATGIAGTITSPIDAGASGASATTAAVKVVLKDANGATLPAGVPVTFSVAGTGVAIMSTDINGVTASDGSVSAHVYGWLNGTAVVTAKAGTVSASGNVYFKQADDGSSYARTVSAVASGNVVTATVKDRYGNPIAGVTLTATRVGTGTFNGTSSTTGVTDKTGSVDFVLTNGSAVVTVAFSSATFGQTAATAGYVDAGITAVTASVAGTVGTAETGVGASFAPAGVNSASVSVADTAAVDAAQAAQDAANEATDAANAATDAANNAMDSADAAQQAAMDAGDKADAALAAVTDLATKVSEIASQISSLSAVVAKVAAAVAKISAKVKA